MPKEISESKTTRFKPEVIMPIVLLAIIFTGGYFIYSFHQENEKRLLDQCRWMWVKECTQIFPNETDRGNNIHD